MELEIQVIEQVEKVRTLKTDKTSSLTDEKPAKGGGSAGEPAGEVEGGDEDLPAHDRGKNDSSK